LRPPRCALLASLGICACALFAPTPTPAPAPVTTPDAAAPAAPPQPPPPPPDPDAPLKKEVQALREEAAALLRAQAELAWKGWALGEAVDFASAYQGHEALFGLESVRKVKELREKAQDEGEAQALRAFQRYLSGEYLARATLSASDAVSRVWATGTLSVDGAEFPFRELETLLASEGHNGKRRRLYKAADPVVRKMDTPLLDREKRLSEAVSALGYPGPLAFAAELREVDLASLAALAEDVLKATEAPYRAAMEELARRELALPLAEVRRADIPRLFRTGDVDTYFPKELEVERLGQALARLGLDPKGLKQLTIDASPHMRKSPRSLALSIEAGADVRLSVRPAPGLPASAQLFHEAGHALQLALARPEAQPVPLLGSFAVGEAVGYLFENLLDDPKFGAATGIPESKLAGHARVSALRKLHLLRRFAGRVLFELAWRSAGGAKKPEDLYRETMAKAMGYPADPEDGARWLSDIEDSLVAADHLRGLLAAAQLEASLAASLGERWWSDARAGQKLAEWLAPGGRLTLESLLQAAGAQALDPGPLAKALERRLGPAAPERAAP
jgi:hypothetical protein